MRERAIYICDIELGKLTFIDEILRQEYTWFCQGKKKRPVTRANEGESSSR